MVQGINVASPAAGDDETVTLPMERPFVSMGQQERLEFELAETGFIPFLYYRSRDQACFFSANSCQKPKLYIDFDSTQNSRLSAQLPWLFLVSRLIHYLKVIQREHIGAAKEKEELQRELETWLNQYVTEDKSPSPAAKAHYPLSMGRITVTDIADEPDFFAVNVTVRPHILRDRGSTGVQLTLSSDFRLPRRYALNCPMCGRQVSPGEVLCECGYALAPAFERKQTVTARTCSICGHDLPQDQVIFVRGKLVCANCRPNSAQTIGEVVTSSDSGVIRQGKLLVKGLDDVLPDRCVKCNAPGDGKRFQKTMVWIHPWAYVGLPFGVLPFFILYFMFRKTARVDFNICKAHVQKRNKAILLTLLLVFSGVALIIFGSAVSSNVMVWVGGLGIIASIVYGIIALPLISPAKITDKHVWLRGAGKEYLHSLAEAKPR